MNVLHPRRGRPVVALALLLGGWVAARATLVEVMQPKQAADGRSGAGLAAQLQRADIRPGLKPSADQIAAPREVRAAIGVNTDPIRSLSQTQNTALPLSPAAIAAPVPLAPPPVAAAQPMPVHTAIGHQLLWMAAVSRIPLPPGLGGAASPAPLPAPFYPASAPGAVPAGTKRWSADGWLLLRRGGAALSSAPAPASYGASQLGAVLRYQLAPASGHRPAAYLRASAALDGSAEKEAALGLSARPIARLPIIAAVEARATQFASGTRLRPAAIAFTQLPPVRLPLGLRAEAYAQAGYVGGAGATAFADGQLRIDHRLAGVGKFELRAGAGSWGGAQHGASRLDIGPMATLGVPMGAASARLAVDWRFRVAGSAAPSSGPALTLSAGF